MKPMKKYSKKDMCHYCGGVNGHKEKCPIKPLDTKISKISICNLENIFNPAEVINVQSK